MPWIKEDECVGCMVCSTVCPVQAINQTADKTAVIDQERCTGCGQCISACPRGAVHADEEEPGSLADTERRPAGKVFPGTTSFSRRPGGQQTGRGRSPYPGGFPDGRGMQQSGGTSARGGRGQGRGKGGGTGRES